MPDLITSNITFHYETANDGAVAGSPILFIAGLASDSASWTPIVSHLANHRLILTDNRGCGRTDCKDKTIEIDDIVADHAALIDHLDCGPVFVVGHSMGGQIAMQLAAQHKSKVKKLALAATSPVTSPHARSVISTLKNLRTPSVNEADWHRAFFHWIFHPSFFTKEVVVEAAIAMALAYEFKQSPENFKGQVEALERSDPARHVSDIEAPTLILAAGEDLLFPARDMETDFSILNDPHFEIVENAGHSLFWDQPAAAATKIRQFLT